MPGNKFQCWNNEQIASLLKNNYDCLNELREMLDFLHNQLEKVKTAYEQYNIHLNIIHIRHQIVEFSIANKELKKLIITG